MVSSDQDPFFCLSLDFCGGLLSRDPDLVLSHDPDLGAPFPGFVLTRIKLFELTHCKGILGATHFPVRTSTSAARAPSTVTTQTLYVIIADPICSTN